LSLVALQNLARACLHNNENYRDEDGRYKLKLTALQTGWKGNTTTEVIDVEFESPGGLKTVNFKVGNLVGIYFYSRSH